jgi:hypothetical protein
VGLPLVERLVEGPGGEGGLVEQPGDDGQRGQALGVVLGLGDEPGQHRREGRSCAAGIGDGHDPCVQRRSGGIVGHAGEQALDLSLLGLRARVVADHRCCGERVEYEG